MAIFNSYVKLPEGRCLLRLQVSQLPLLSQPFLIHALL